MDTPLKGSDEQPHTTKYRVRPGDAFYEAVTGKKIRRRKKQPDHALEAHSRAPGDELWRRSNRAPLWLRLLFAPFLLVAVVSGAGILIWFAAIVARVV